MDTLSNGEVIFLLFLIPVMVGLAIGVGRLTYNMVTTTTGWAIMLFISGWVGLIIVLMN